MTTPTPAAPSTPTRRRGPLIALAIAIVVVVAAVAIGIGIAIGSGTAQRTSDTGPVGGAATPTDAPASSSGTAGQAADFARARDAAEKAVPGVATEITREGEGWTVDVRKSGDAADIDVVLGSDFSVTRVGDPDGTADGGDVAPAGSLSGEALGRAIDAALASAGSGTATSIELADTAPEAYEVKVSRSGAETTVTLGADYTVIRTEQDD